MNTPRSLDDRLRPATAPTTAKTPRDVLREVFGFDDFRPYQEAVIQRLLRGEHALVIMPTGGGKSLCYQLPALLRSGTAVVVSPLIALMQDQVAALRQLGVRAAFLNSSLERRAQQAVRRDLQHGDLDLLYVAPERLMTPRFLRQLDETDVSLFAIDEAHCMSQWGHDFRPDYLDLAQLRERFPQVPCIAVTATADVRTQRDLLRRLHFPGEALFVAGFDRPNIRYTVVRKKRPKQQLLRFIEEEHDGEAGIVYCLSRKSVERTAQWLSDQGHAAVPYHAGCSSAERQERQDRFLREDDLIVVATVAFGMGIDKPNVRFVAHLDLPKSLEAYYQETGRAGRDGRPADAWMTYRLSDVVKMRRLLADSGGDDAHQRKQQQKLSAIFGYCETAECRRRVLLRYFGEERAEGCGNCDTCLHPVDTFDGTVAAQKALSCAYRTGERFGASHLADVLTGSDTKKIRRHGHKNVSTYGVGADRSKKAWRSVLRQLVAARYLRVDPSRYGALRLTDACRPVLQGEKTVHLRKDPSPKTPSGGGQRSATAPEDEPLETDAERALFERLREERLALAKKQDVPAYVIFHDKTLRAMARRRPATPGDFGTLPGVGTVKKERYGEAFLRVIAGHEGATPDHDR